MGVKWLMEVQLWCQQAQNIMLSIPVNQGLFKCLPLWPAQSPGRNNQHY